MQNLSLLGYDLIEVSEIILQNIDEELEEDLLGFINCEIAIEEQGLFSYFQKISVEEILDYLFEYEAKWNPSSKLYELILDEIMFYRSTNSNYRQERLGYVNSLERRDSNGGVSYFVNTVLNVEFGKGGIYQIRNNVNNKIYVGSTINFIKRKREHFGGLKGKYHGNDHLQKSWDFYGNKSFTFEVLEYVQDKEKLFEREAYWLEKLAVTDDLNGYNIFAYPIGMMVGHYSESTKKKISFANSGENNARAILTNNQVWEIKMLLHHTDLRVGEVAQLYNVRTQSIGDIKSGLRWKNVVTDKNETIPQFLFEKYEKLKDVSISQKLTRKQAMDIKLIIRDTDLLNTEIADIFNTGATTISHIRTGETWSQLILTDNEVLSEDLKVKIVTKSDRRKPPVFLDENSIKDIKMLLIEGKLRYFQIGEIFNVSESVISNIKNNNSYKEIEVKESDQLSSSVRQASNRYIVKKMRNNCKTSLEQVKHIKVLLKNTTYSQREIGEIVGVPSYTVNNIACNKIWNDIIAED